MPWCFKLRSKSNKDYLKQENSELRRRLDDCLSQLEERVKMEERIKAEVAKCAQKCKAQTSRMLMGQKRHGDQEGGGKVTSKRQRADATDDVFPEKIRKTFDELEEDLKQIGEREKTMRVKTADLEGAMRKEISSLKTSQDERQKETNLLKQEIDKLRTTNLNLERRLEGAQYQQKTAAELSQGKTILEQKVFKLAKEMEELKQVNRKREDENRKVQEECLKLKNSIDEYQNKEQVLRRKLNEVEIQRDAQFPIFSDISSLYKTLQACLETKKKEDVTAANERLALLCKETRQVFGEKVRALNCEMLVLVETLDGMAVSHRHETFAKRTEEEIEKLRKLENVTVTASTADYLKRKVDDLIALREIRNELDYCQQVLSNFPFVAAQRKNKYESIVSKLMAERSRLQDLVRSSPLDPYVVETLRQIAEINRGNRELREAIDKFRGTKADKTYLDLDHKLLGNVMRIDDIQVRDNETIRQKRKDSIRFAYECIEKLKGNVVDAV